MSSKAPNIGRCIDLRWSAILRLIVVLPDDDRDECKEHRIVDADDGNHDAVDFVMFDKLRCCKCPPNDDVTFK